jgi:hypothetical protein
MTDKLWKQAERKLAALLGGKRVPVSGRQRGFAPDIDHNLFSIEVKHRQSLPSWIHDAMAQAVASQKDGQIPIVILHEKGMAYPNSLTFLTVSGILDLWRKMSKHLYDVVMDITQRLEQGEEDYSTYLQWLIDTGLGETEALNLLDKLRKFTEVK